MTAPVIPTSWDVETRRGVLWRVRAPLPGNGSPVVWGRQVFVTGARRERRELYCFDGESGRVQWRLRVPKIPGSPSETDLPDMTGPAAPTPATDGERVCALFGNMDLICADMQGRVLWTRNLGLPESPYGHASSPVMHGGLVIAVKDHGMPGETKSQVMAFRAESGEPAWEQSRDVAASWATPILIRHGGTDQLITCADPWVIAYEPRTGEELWRAKVLRDDVAPSPGYEDGVVYVANIRSCAAAISVSGRGDVTRTHVRWRIEDELPSIPSVLAGRGLVFLLTTGAC